jgi:hypothetical protein
MSPKAALDPSKDRPSIYKALMFLAGRRTDVRDSLCACPGSNKDAPAAATASEGKRFTIESDLALSKMSLGMTAERTGDVDQDFVAMMTPHHQGAIDIARAELKYGHTKHPTSALGPFSDPEPLAELGPFIPQHRTCGAGPGKSEKCHQRK